MKSNQKGFSVVEILIVIVVVGLIGTVGWLVNDRQKNNKSTETASNSNTATEQKETTKEEVKAVDPYNGWLTFCDDKAALCFKYPSDWTIDSEAGTSATVTSKEQKARVVYASEYVRDGGIREVTPVVLENAIGLAGYSIVGTYSIYLDRHSVVYDVVGGTVEGNGFKIGQATKSLDNPRFDYNNVTYKLSGWPLKDDSTAPQYSNADEARQWFSSDDAKKVALILQSLTKK